MLPQTHKSADELVFSRRYPYPSLVIHQHVILDVFAGHAHSCSLEMFPGCTTWLFVDVRHVGACVYVCD